MANGYAGAMTAGGEWTVQAHWDDLQGSVSEGTGGAALTYAAFRDTPFKFASFRDAQNDELHMAYQMPHGWDPDSGVRPHVHIIPLSAATGVVRFTGQYLWARHSVEVAANATWTPFTVDYSIAAADVNKLKVVSLAQIAAPTGAIESDVLLVYLKRAGSDGADTYAGNIAVVSVDCHIQRVKFGTIEEFPGA